jgi:anaerobic selenocysteine-containing dehydrogenase
VLVEVGDDDRPLRVTGDPEHPVSRGFVCRRGLAAVEYFENPGRLDVPLKRVGAPGEGRWARVTWDEAMADIARRLAVIRERDGAEAVAHLAGTFHGTDHGIGVRFMNLFGSPNYGGTGIICAGPKLTGEALTYGFGPCVPEIVPGETRTVLLWGRHPSASAPPHWGKIVAARRAGATLIVIDPVGTDEARAADLWLQPRPGTDAALALGLLHVIAEEHLHDAEFTSRWTVGFEQLRQRIAEYSPARVGEITWLAPELIARCARLYASARPAAISSGSPNGMGRNALAWERAKAMLVALTGNLDRRGGNRLLGPPERVQTVADLELADELPARQRAKRLGGDRFRLQVDVPGRLNRAATRVWPHHRQMMTAFMNGAAHPPTIFRAILDGEPYPVRALLVQSNNAIGAYPNAHLVRGALKSPNLELLVVQELFMTATAQYAHYVLPTASWLEKSYMYVSGWDTTVVATPRVVAPRHERRSDYEFYRDLGLALGQQGFWPPTLEALWDEMLAPAGLAFDELAASSQNWRVDPDRSERHESIDPATGGPVGFTTPSGKVELVSSILAESGYDPLPSFEEPLPAAEAIAYPYLLLTGSTRIDATHQDHRQVASLRRRHPDPTVRMHPVTAGALGIAAGDWVWIESPRGRVQQRAELTDRLHPSMVEAERWWYPERDGTEPELFGVIHSNVNVLTNDDPAECDPAYGAWPYRLGRCRLTRSLDGGISNSPIPLSSAEQSPGPR